MADPADKQALWKNAVRWSLIPLLVIVLLVVVFWPDGGNEQGGTEEADSLQGLSAEPAAGDEAAKGRSDATASRQFRPMDLSSILEHDPFALPAALGGDLNSGPTPTEEQAAAEERERIAEIVESLQQEKLSVVFRDKGRVSALLGNRVVREGEEIEAGIRILKITPQGLTLEVSGEAIDGADDD